MKKYYLSHWLKLHTVCLVILSMMTLPAHAFQIYVCTPKGKATTYQDKPCRNEADMNIESITLELENSVQLGLPSYATPAKSRQDEQPVTNNAPNSINNSWDNNQEIPEGVVNSENFSQGLQTIQQMRENPDQRLDDIESAINQAIGN